MLALKTITTLRVRKRRNFNQIISIQFEPGRNILYKLAIGFVEIHPQNFEFHTVLELFEELQIMKNSKK